MNFGRGCPTIEVFLPLLLSVHFGHHTDDALRFRAPIAASLLFVFISGPRFLPVSDFSVYGYWIFSFGDAGIPSLRLGNG